MSAAALLLVPPGRLRRPQGFYAALFVGGKGTLHLVVGLVAGVNMKSGRVHLEGEGVAGAVHVVSSTRTPAESSA